MLTFHNFTSPLMSTIQKGNIKLTTTMHNMYENVIKQNEALIYVNETNIMQISCTKATNVSWFPFSYF